MLKRACRWIILMGKLQKKSSHILSKDGLRIIDDFRRARGFPPATKSLMLESVTRTQSAPGYCCQETPDLEVQRPAGLKITRRINMRRKAKGDRSSPVNIIVFVKVHKARSNLARHPLKYQRVRGHRVCCPTATEVSFNVSLLKQASFIF